MLPTGIGKLTAAGLVRAGGRDWRHDHPAIPVSPASLPGRDHQPRFLGLSPQRPQTRHRISDKQMNLGTAVRSITKQIQLFIVCHIFSWSLALLVGRQRYVAGMKPTPIGS